MRFYEDFTVGDSTTLGSHRVSKDEIVAFARDWDPRPFHLDEEAARASVFGGLTASSCHAYAIASLITARSEGDVAAAAMLSVELRLSTPIRPDDELVLSTSCLSKRPSASRPGLGVIETRSTLTNQTGEATLELTSTWLVRQREGTPGDRPARS